MSSDQKIKSLEERVEALEAQNAELRQMLRLPGTDQVALDAAILAIVEKQDVSMLDSYLKRGGKIPVNAKPGESGMRRSSCRGGKHEN